VKPYYEESGIVIYNADCREVLPSLPKVDLVLTDPPYGINYVRGGGGRGKHNRRNDIPVTGDTEPFDPAVWLAFPEVILWGANHYARRLPESRWLAWDKLDGLEAYDDFSDVEFAWRSGGAGKDRIFRYMWKGICQAGEKFPRVHPTQKPEALMRWCLNLAPNAQVVFDPFMGSGTTLRAAKDLGRKAIGIEIEERYCEIAANRLRQEVLSFEATV
jgi:site-specific DNA-methyltransferase (adenine-specific)